MVRNSSANNTSHRLYIEPPLEPYSVVFRYDIS